MKQLLATFTLIGLGAMVLSGCGNYSNDDLEFLDALPQRSAVQVNVPQNGNALTAGEAPLYTLTVANGEGSNQFAEQLLGAIDLIRTLPPSKRTIDSRTWGPFDDHSAPGFEDQFVLTRIDEHFEFELDERKKAMPANKFVAWISGAFYTESAEAGHGTILLDLDALKQIGRTSATPDAGLANLHQATIVYFNDLTPREVNTTLDGVDNDGGPVHISTEYQENADHSGQMSFDLYDDFNGDGSQEFLQIFSRWDSTGAGRADSSMSQGTLAALGVHDTTAECWDAHFAETYFNSELVSDATQQVVNDQGLDCGVDGHGPCPDGNINSCVLPPPSP